MACRSNGGEDDALRMLLVSCGMKARSFVGWERDATEAEPMREVGGFVRSLGLCT